MCDFFRIRKDSFATPIKFYFDVFFKLLPYVALALDSYLLFYLAMWIYCVWQRTAL